MFKSRGTIQFTLALLCMALILSMSGCAKKNKGANALGTKGGISTSGSNSLAPGETRLDGTGVSGRLGNPESLANDLMQEGAPTPELPNVYFLLDSDKLEAAAIAVLNKNAVYLKGQAKLQVVLRGHCDDSGTEEYNFALGSKRAQAVRDYLVDKGIHPTRMETVSFGESLPAVEGEDEASRAKNRRVEFFVYTIDQ